jgi:hypothetical protein
MRGRPRPRCSTAPRSSSIGSTGCSCRSPPVITCIFGLPPRSQRRWTSCCSHLGSGRGLQLPDPSFGSCRVLMHSDDRAVDEVQAPVQPSLRIGSSLQRRQDAVPNAHLLPAIEAARDGLPGAVTLQEAAPRASDAQDSDDAIEDGAVIVGGTTRTGLLRWKQRAQLLPLRVGEIALAHTTKRGTSLG